MPPITDGPEVTLIEDSDAPAPNPLMVAAKPALDALRSKYPELVTLIHKGQVLAFRPMSRQEYTRFRAQIADPKKRSDATENLVRSVVVYPDRAAFNAFLDRYPAAAEAIGDEVIEDAGGLKVERQ